MKLPGDRSESFLGGLHSAEVITILELDVSIGGRHLQGPVVTLLVLVGFLIVSDLRPSPQISKTTCCRHIEFVLLQVFDILLPSVSHRQLLRRGCHSSFSGSPLASSNTLALCNLLLVEGGSTETFVLECVNLLYGRLHDVAKLGGRCQSDFRIVFLGISLNGRLLLLILFHVFLVVQHCDLLCHGGQGCFALLGPSVRGLLHQSSLLRKLFIELRVFFVGAVVLL
mmetsp:Transcript_41284/g.62386  ORF Transcript_41284/g.62386 Transcript_41284/m.62386 type:complete len:226 (-) Transcript_41284:470-1147(-)